MAISRTSAVSLLVFALAIGLCHGGQFKLTWTLCCTTPTFTLPTVAPGSTAGFAGESSASGSNIPEAQATAMKAQIAAQMGISASQLCCLTLTTTDSGTMMLAVEVDEELTPPPLINATISDGTNTFITNGTQPRITEVESNGNNTTVIIIAVVFSVLGAILFAVMAYILYRKHKAEKEKEHSAMGTLQKPVSRPNNDIPLTLTSTHGNTTTPTAPATLQRSDIADEKARYLWNAAANAVADPHPGGHPVAPKMAFVADELTS